MCTFYCTLRKKKGFIILPKDTDVRIQQRIHQKDVYIMLLCQGCCWIGKNTNKKFSCVMVLIMRPTSTLKFQFVFGFNECLWEIFSLLNFENFWFYIWVVVVYLWLLILQHKWLQVTSYPMPMNKNLGCKDHQIYIMNCWEISVKGKSNLNFIRVIKVHFLIDIFYSYSYMLWSRPF